MTEPDFPFVEIEWWDAHAMDEWTEPESADWSPLTVVSRGWKVHEDGDVVVLAASITEDGALMESLVIPVGCVRKQFVIELSGEG